MIVLTRLLLVVVPFSIFTFHFLLFLLYFFLPFHVPNVVILFVSFFSCFPLATHPNTTPNMILKIFFVAQMFKKHKIEEKLIRIKIGHETQT